MGDNKKSYVWFPFIGALLVVGGIYLGKVNSINERIPVKDARFNKIEYLLNVINSQYVDSVDVEKLVEDAMPTLLSELDPHSVYIPAKDLEATNEELEGSFSGIGVQFSLQNDTVMVVGVVSGGPSEKIGILPGDRIVEINDSVFTGKDITNEKVMKTLRGQKGTDVKVGIRRSTASDILNFNITRGDIPVHSVDATYMIDDNKGYIKISKFGRTTYNEMISSLAKLTSEGAQEYIIDLRGNSGGYLDIAINMINEFLPKDQLIVYTDGVHAARSEARSNGRGVFQKTPLVVLIDEWSASASEIFAGAIQDNDRGTVIGRRSFGKGLVQQQIPFSDGSAMRLTVARYYIPSGRSIQKDYKMGKDEEYGMDILNRFNHGEFYNQDSIKMNDSLKFYTSIGRPVYGGGGVMPDIFVPSDTTGVTSYLNNLVNKGLIYQFAFDYSDKYRDKLLEYPTYDALLKYLKSQNLVEQVAQFAATKGVKKRPVYINISKGVIERQVISYIMRNIQGDDSFYKYFYSDDNTLNKAIDVLNNGNAFPVIIEEVPSGNNTENAENNTLVMLNEAEAIEVDSISDFGE